jgi:hypothetical protein
MGKSKKNFAEFIVAPADASSFGGTKREGEGFGQTSVYFKRKSPELPYRVANEYICSRLGRFIGLPVPPHSLMRIEQREYCFAILDFDSERSSLFPINPAACVVSDPRLCTGILLFDVLIGNPDRHDENLRTDDRLAPKRIVVYDHDVALLGALPPGTDRLAELGSMLGIAGETPTSTVHCLLPALSTAEHFDEWLGRIADTPPWFIKDTCETVLEKQLVSRDDAHAAEKFLIDRKNSLGRILDRHRDKFTAITKWDSYGSLFR